MQHTKKPCTLTNMYYLDPLHCVRLPQILHMIVRYLHCAFFPPITINIIIIIITITIVVEDTLSLPRLAHTTLLHASCPS